MQPWPELEGDISPLLATSPEPRKWFAHNRLLLGRAAVLTGIGGSSKTTAMYHMALGGVLGHLPWGWKVDTTGTALLFLTEDTADDVHHSLDAMADGLGDEERELLGRKLKIFPMAGEDVRLLSIDQGSLFENSRGMGLIERCKQYGDVVFIGLDPALALTEGDEMSQSHQRYLGQYCDKLAIKTGACVMLTTHSTKSSANADELTSHQSRGGGGITDAVRAEFVLRTMTAKEATLFGIADQAERKRYVQLVCTKGNKLPLDAFAPVWLERGRGGLLSPADLSFQDRQDAKVTVGDMRILGVLRDLCKDATPMLAEWRAECETLGFVSGRTAEGRVTQMKRAVSRLAESSLIRQGVGRGFYIPVYDGDLA